MVSCDSLLVKYGQDGFNGVFVDTIQPFGANQGASEFPANGDTLAKSLPYEIAVK